MLLLSLQPFTSVPVTEYVCDVAGVNATPFVMPGVHVYVFAPLAVKVIELPEQTTFVGVGVIVKLIGGLTFIVIIVGVATQLPPNEPETVYVTAAVCVTIACGPLVEIIVPSDATHV